MKHWKWIASSGLAAVLAIAYVSADPRATGEMRERGPGDRAGWGAVLGAFDTDKDGEITRAELSQSDTAFDALDRNSDGVISAADFPRRRHGSQMVRAIGYRLANVADTDDSGDVTEAEWQAVVASIEIGADGKIVPESLHEVLGIEREPHEGHGPGPLGPPSAEDLNAIFGQLDRDDNGVLEGDELQRGERRRRGGPGMHGPRHGGPGAMADADRDGEVTAAEWDALFDKLDADGNGTVTRDELRAGHPGEKRMRRQARSR